MSTYINETAKCDSPTHKARLGKVLAFCAPIAVAAMLGEGMSASVQASSNAVDAVQCRVGGTDLMSRVAALSGTWFRKQSQDSSGAACEDESHGDETLWNPLTNAWLTADQLRLLNIGFDIGYLDGGETHAKLVQAVLMQETIAGQISRIGHLSAPVGKRSYGVMQMKVTAARDVLRRHPGFGRFATDEELIARLVADDEFNIHMASAFLKYLRARTQSDEEALVAYNIGYRASKAISDVADFEYVKDVGQYLAEVVEPFNEKFGKDAASVTRM